MAMAIRCFEKLKNLAIHFEFGHSLILAIRWSGVRYSAIENNKDPVSFCSSKKVINWMQLACPVSSKAIIKQYFQP